MRMEEVANESWDLSRELQGITGENVMLCDLCQRCTLVCPTAYAMGMKPHELMGSIQRGEVQAIYWSGAIWLCISCEACNACCPKGINILRVIEGLREMARRFDSYNPETATASMHRIFLNLVERWGKAYLLPLIVLTHLTMLAPFKDLELMSPLLLKRRSKLLPRQREGAKKLRQILSRIQALEQEEQKKRE